MNRKKSDPARFWGKITSRTGRSVTGLDPAASARQGEPIEFAVEALETMRHEIAIPRKSAAQSGLSPPRRPRFMEGFKKFRNLLRDSLDRICPWENDFLGIFSSPVSIPGSRIRTSLEAPGNPWGNQVVPANSSLLSPNRRHVTEVQDIAFVPQKNADSWVDSGEVFYFSPDLRHNFHRVDRSYNFALEYPEAYYEPRGPYGRLPSNEDEGIEEQQNNGVEGEVQDDDMMFSMSV